VQLTDSFLVSLANALTVSFLVSLAAARATHLISISDVAVDSRKPAENMARKYDDAVARMSLRGAG
jgi:hypothetical protein